MVIDDMFLLLVSGQFSGPNIGQGSGRRFKRQSQNSFCHDIDLPVPGDIPVVLSGMGLWALDISVDNLFAGDLFGAHKYEFCTIQAHR